MAVKGMYLMKTGQMLSYAGRHVADLDPDQRITSQVFSALIVTDDGNIIVDTGIDTDPKTQGRYDLIGLGHEGGFSGGEFKVAVKPEDDIRLRLREEHNLTPKDINYVINTHLHFDHVGGNRFFTDSTIIVHKEEYRFAIFPDKYFAIAYDRSLWDIPSLKYELIEGDKVIVPGVTVIHTPGHTPGHLAVIVDCPRDGTVILGGDTLHNEQNYTRRIPISADNCMSGVLLLQSIDRLRAVANRTNGIVIPAHDIKFYNKISKEYH